ncbi:MAG: hypothetical protein V1735_05050 [Nanoarchaeota archaeon]
MPLTPIEQKVYKQFYSQACTLEEVSAFLKNYRQAVVACKNLVEKQYFLRIKGGLYAVVPFELAPEKSAAFVPDRYKVADKMIGEHFLSHNTALELHCGAKPMQKAFISSPSRVPEVKMAGTTFTIITTKHFFGATAFSYQNSMLTVSDKERTIIDCLRQVKFTAGFEQLKQSFPLLAPINFDTLLHYLKRIDEKTLYSRVSYTMGMLRQELKVPQAFLDALPEGKHAWNW